MRRVACLCAAALLVVAACREAREVEPAPVTVPAPVTAAAPAAAQDDPRTVETRGRMLLARLDAMKEQLAHQPKTPDVLRSLGDVYYQNGRWADAAEHYRSFVAMEPGDVAVRGRLAAACLRMGVVEEAIVHAQACLAIAAEHVECRRVRDEARAAAQAPGGGGAQGVAAPAYKASPY
jgi:tetratricopeptide (TPR) repeat protein